jgi:hypothetical protein
MTTDPSPFAFLHLLIFVSSKDTIRLCTSTAAAAAAASTTRLLCVHLLSVTSIESHSIHQLLLLLLLLLPQLDCYVCTSLLSQA